MSNLNEASKTPKTSNNSEPKKQQSQSTSSSTKDSKNDYADVHFGASTSRIVFLAD